MTKPAIFLLFCVFLFFSAGCRIFHSQPRAPVPPSVPAPTETQTAEPRKGQENAEDTREKSEKEIAKENKKRIKTKKQITGEIDSFREQFKKTEELFATKRAQGIDASKAEEILKNSKSLLEEAERLYLEANLTENYEPVFGLLQAIEDSFEKIKEEIKKAPRFREKTKPKPKEYMDDRDIIFEKIGHIDPTRIQTGPMFSFRFFITNPTEHLNPKCAGGFGSYELKYPPKVKIMEFNKGQEGTYQFVLIENDPNIERFTSQNSLSPEQRDQALSVLCESQGSGFENFRFLAAYKNAPVGTPEMYLEQLISSRFRFADQFGVSAMTESAKGGAALADLELVSLVFSTKIDSLSRAQAELLVNIHSKVKDDLPSNERLQKAFDKIESWQYTISPKKGDKKDFLNLVADRQDRQEIEILINEFEDTLKQLAKEFEWVQKELLRFKKDYGSELVFYDDENPTMVLLLRGVGFKVEEASARTLFKKDIPQLSVRLEFLYYRSKNDEEPPLVGDKQFEIESANKYIDVSKDYQRLTSFMLGWPLLKTLPMGNYQLKLTITDEIREKAVIQEVNFTVLPANLRGK